MWKELRICLALAVPLALAQLAQMATGFVDTVMMGRLGSEVLAGGGLGAASFNFLAMVGVSTLSSVSPLVAEAYGASGRGHNYAGAVPRISDLFWQGLALALAFSIGGMGLLATSGFWLPWIDPAADTLPLAQQYLRIMVWACPPVLAFGVLRSFLAALGHTRAVLLMVGLGTAINVVGNYGLALGRLGLPALGLQGIAVASVVASWVMAAAMVTYIASHPQFAQFQLGRGRLWPALEIRELLGVGLPIGGLAVVEGGMFTVTTFLAAQFGTATLAAHQMALQTAAVTFMVPMGVGMGATVRVGQLMGQGQRRQARLAGSLAIGISATFMGAMALMMWIVPGWITALYIDTADPANQEVVALAATLLGVAAVFQIVDGIQVTAAGALRGMKDTRVPLLIGLVAYWGVGLPVGYGLARSGWGGAGLWWGEALGLLLAAVTLSWRFGRRVRPLRQAIDPLRE